MQPPPVASLGKCRAREKTRKGDNARKENKMDYKDFNYTNDKYLILVKLEHYTRTASGKSWKSQPDAVERVIYTPEQYTNFVTAAPWFNKFFATDFNGNRTKARCTISRGYTAAGYLPTGSRNTSPDGREQTRASIEFLSKRELLRGAGYRERAIIENIKTWEYSHNNGYMTYRFTSKDGSAAEYSLKLERWTN